LQSNVALFAILTAVTSNNSTSGPTSCRTFRITSRARRKTLRRPLDLALNEENSSLSVSFHSLIRVGEGRTKSSLSKVVRFRSSSLIGHFAMTEEQVAEVEYRAKCEVKREVEREVKRRAARRAKRRAARRAKRRAKGKARREGFILPAPMIWRSGAKNGGSSAERANQQGRNITGHDTSGSLCHAFPLHIGVVRRSSFVRHRWC
jgi:hypothetical protein